MFIDSDINVTNSSSDTEASNNSINENDIEIHTAVDVKINNIQEESNLIQYTEGHFINRLNTEFNMRQSPSSLFENYIRSNSPITISNNGSGSDSDSYHNSESDDYGMKKLVYYDAEKTLDKYYSDNVDNKYSSELDILTTYMRGQKNLYIQAKHLSQRKLNCLMIPALFFTALITIIAPFINCMPGSGTVISTINAIIALLISLINYLKLESAIEIYLQMANHYDKLETGLEFTNSKLLLLENENEKKKLALSRIKEIEKKLSDIKDTTTFLIPEEIKHIFPIICSINIFSFIKKIEIYKTNLIVKFKDVKNEIRYILYRWKKKNIVVHDIDDIHEVQDIEFIKEKNRLLFLYDIKDKMKTEILDYKNSYGMIDDIFSREINNAEINKKSWICFFVHFIKPMPKLSMRTTNPVINKYFDFIFIDG